MDKRFLIASVARTNDDDGDDAEWDDVEEDEQIDIFAVDTKCLFCDEHALLTAMIEHLKTAHSFDVYELKTVHSFSCYEYICFVNYIRTCKPSIEKVKQQLRGNEKLWRDDKYLKPVIQDEPFLLLDIDNEDDDAEMEAGVGLTDDAKGSAEKMDQVNGDYSNGMTLFTAPSKPSSSNAKSGFVALQQQLAALRAENMALRHTMKQLIEDEGEEEGEGEEAEEEEGGEQASSSATTKFKSRDANNAAEDEWYFDSYDDFQIHLEMLTDRVRTDGYRDFVQRNASIFADKTVLDIGCGTGILSMFVGRDTAAQRVVAVDRAGIAFDAMAIVRENELTQRVTVKHALVEDLRPQSSATESAKGKRKSISDVEHVDIIISEWMGYALLYECMLDSVLAARDMFTVRGPSGEVSKVPLVFPNVYTVWLAGVDDCELSKRYVTYWNDVYGFSMSTMRSRVCRSILQDVTTPENIVTNAANLREFDLRTLQRGDLEPFLLFSEFELRAKPKATEKVTQVSAFCLWFDVAFVDCPQPVTFTTSPSGEKTHWQQSFMFLDEPIQLAADDKLDCRLVIRRNPKEPRHLVFEFFINGLQRTFMMS